MIWLRRKQNVLFITILHYFTEVEAEELVAAYVQESDDSKCHSQLQFRPLYIKSTKIPCSNNVPLTN